MIKYYLTSNLIGAIEVNPVDDGNYIYESIEDYLIYRHKKQGEYIFTGEDYDFLLTLINEECETITISVYKVEQAVETLYWSGKFNMNDVVLNTAECTIKVTPETNDVYACIMDRKDEDVNIFAGDKIEVKKTIGTYDEITCIESGDTCNNEPVPDENSLVDNCIVNPADWCVASNIITQSAYTYYDPADGYPDGECIDWIHRTKWHRELADGTCNGGNPVPPDYSAGWMLIDNDCPGDSPTYWRCPGDEPLVGGYTNARTIEQVLNNILTGLDCFLEIKSDFFDINSEGDAPSNDAYNYALAHLGDILIAQKSDIKRDNNDSTENAWTITFSEFMNDLRKLFNVYFIIKEGVLIVEHYSYFNFLSDRSFTGVTWEITARENKVKKELYYYMDEMCSDIFAAKPIVYNCGYEEREERCAAFSTDLVYISNPDNVEKISDAGFVFIGCIEFQGEYAVEENNIYLSFQNLQENLHKHGRRKKAGALNDVQQLFISTIPYKKQNKFSFEICKGDKFVSWHKINTDIGAGKVHTAIENIYTNIIEVELKY